MNLTVTIASDNQTSVWPISPDDYVALHASLGEVFGWPTVTREGEPYDLKARVEQRMGSIGDPQRRITVTPVENPEKAPEPVTVPSEPAKDPVPA